MPATTRSLTVAVTGPTGTFGFGLIPLLEGDERIGRIVGIARRRFDPAQHGWTKMTYRQGDVRDPAALAQAFRGADVVVPFASPVTEWSEAACHPVIIDCTKAKRELGRRPRYSGLDALRATV